MSQCRHLRRPHRRGGSRSWERASSGKEKENVSDPWGGAYLPRPTCVWAGGEGDMVITWTVAWLPLATMKWLACGLSLGMASCHGYGRNKVWSLLCPYPCVLAYLPQQQTGQVGIMQPFLSLWQKNAQGCEEKFAM